MFPLFLQLLEKKVLDPNGPYISTFQTNIRKSDPIFDFQDSLFGQDEKIALCLKIISQKLTIFVFGNT